MKKQLFILIILIIVPLANGLYSQELAEHQREMSLFFDKIHAGLAKSAGNLPIKHHDVNSALTREHTRQIQAAQTGLEKSDNNEEIIFCLNDGIYVQQADGTGRRQLIRRGAGYKWFSYPAWSLDGTQIAFAANQDDSRVVDLVVANADGSDPTVILTLNQGYYHSYIWSISWSWDSEYIMFTYAFDDANSNSLFVVCTILQSGGNFATGSGPDQSFCQYEPVTGSNRYAYIAAGRPFYMNTDLRVSNLNGSNNYAWWTLGGIISGFTHIAWNKTNSIYTVIRYWDQYPNKECLIRFNRAGRLTTNEIINISDYNASLWSPTVSPDRNFIYDSELYANNSSALWLTKLTPSITVESKGSGAYPNWRQKIPALNKPVLTAPDNNATNVGVESNSLLWVYFGWQAVDGATSYNFQLFRADGSLLSEEKFYGTFNRSILGFNTKYFWRMQAQNSSGAGAWSDMRSFTTAASSSVEDKQQVVDGFALQQNYPNPFNPSTTIPFSIAQPGLVTLKVYDAAGKDVEILIAETLQPGNYDIEWNGSNHPSGIYFYKLTAKGLVQAKKFVLMK